MCPWDSGFERRRGLGVGCEVRGSSSLGSRQSSNSVVSGLVLSRREGNYVSGTTFIHITC
jgi:hypothetical protein